MTEECDEKCGDCNVYPCDPSRFDFSKGLTINDMLGRVKQIAGQLRHTPKEVNKRDR